MKPSAPVAVIGAGLAGIAAAAELARRGQPVDLYDDPTGRPASSIPLAVLRPHFAGQRDPLERVRSLGLRVTRHWLRSLEAHGADSGRRSDGLLLLTAGERWRRRRDRLPRHGVGPRRLSIEDAHAAAGVAPGEAALFHPQGACVDPAAFSRSLLTVLPGIRVIRARIGVLRRNGSWQLIADNGDAAGDYNQVVIAAGPGSTALWPALERCLAPARGQATAIAATPRSAGQRLTLSGDGYITPAIDGPHWVGATLQRGRDDCQPCAVDDDANRTRFAAVWGECGAVVDAFVAVRAVTRDRLPIAGCLAPGLWISAGHGAHGLCTAPVCGRLVAAGVAGKRHPLMTLTAADRPALWRSSARKD